MRVRRSSRSASAVSIVNDRIAVESADFSARTDMWLLTLVVWRTPGGVRLPTGRVSEPERIARRGLRRSAHPPYAQPAGGRRRSLLENPQIAGIEDLRVLTCQNRAPRIWPTEIAGAGGAPPSFLRRRAGVD